MTRVLGSIVIKNEADRYLDSCLEWASTFLDEIFVFDDQSTDASTEIASSHGCQVVIRGDGTPSFIQHESDFREEAWRQFTATVSPKPGDWILSFDADEFLVTRDGSDVSTALMSAVEKAEAKGAIGIILPFQEIFKMNDDEFWVRKDGFWGSVQGPRLFKYQPGNVSWSGKAMGSGSEPLYVVNGKKNDTPNLSFLHLGYAKDEDKKSKYARYSSLAHGHNDKHIQSIPQKPTLELWDGAVPEVKL